MLYKRNHLFKRKIIGGSLFGNVFNSAKKIATSATKTALKNASQRAANVLKSSNVKALLASKVKDAASQAKQLAKTAVKEQLGVSSIEDAKKLALTAATKKANEIGSNLAQKAMAKASKRLSPAMQQTIQQLARNPQAKKALTKKSMDILKTLMSSPASTSTGDRALMSNILAGSGIKRIA